MQINRLLPLLQKKRRSKPKPYVSFNQLLQTLYITTKNNVIGIISGLTGLLGYIQLAETPNKTVEFNLNNEQYINTDTEFTVNRDDEE